MDTAADALLVIDVQRAFVAGPTAAPSADTLASAVRRLLAVARDAGALVVHLQNDGHVGAADEPGADGWKLLFPPAAGELVIRKSDDDAFVGTGLESALLDNGVKTVALCGVQSEMCVAPLRHAGRCGAGCRSCCHATRMAHTQCLPTLAGSPFLPHT